MEIAGLDADSLVSQLMQVERRPLTALQQRKTAAQSAADAIGRLRTGVDAFRAAASKLAQTSTFDRFTTTVSNDAVLAATVGSGASTGSLSFTVDRLAQAHGLRSTGTVAAGTAPITSASVISIGSGTRAIGIGAVSAGAGLGVGSTTVVVTQASSSAAAIGAPLAGTTTITTGVNDSFDISVNGANRTITLAAGAYDRTQLASAVQSALTASGGGVTAAVTNDGALTLATVREGSAATLQINGGTALATLGLGVDAAAHIGIDGIIDVAGTTTTASSIEPGSALAIGTGSGTLAVTLSGGLRVGQSTVKTVSTGSRSLTDVASAINGANAGVSAVAVKVATGAWRLQISARTTGELGGVAIDGAVLDGIGGLVESSAAQNAQITIGSGPGAYQVEATGNTFANVLNGVTITAKSTSTSPVTIDVARDDQALAADVTALVSAANTLLADIKVQTRFDPATRVGGALSGNATIRRLADQVRAALGAQVSGLAGTATNGLAATVGIQLGRDGSFTFDKATFLSAVGDDPTAIARLFARGGTATGSAVFGSATERTATGSYAVEVTTAATQATSGTLFSGGVAASSRLAVRVGTTTASIDVTPGQTAAQVADALNDSFGQSGLNVTAEIDGAGVRVRANAWGAAGNFELNPDVLGGGVWGALTGNDVQGTIAGVTAIGVGRTLKLAAVASSPAAGLSIDIAGGTSGVLGPVAYQPGLAARVVEVAHALTRETDGVLTTAKASVDSRVKSFTDQMDRLEDRLAVRETNLRRRWSNVQSLLGGLQSQGSWLSSQIASLPTNRG